MKKIVSLLLVLCMLSSVLQMTVLAAENRFQQEELIATVGYSESKTFNDYFPDPVLAEVVAAALWKKPEDNISEQQLQNIWQIYSQDYYGNIKDLSGISYLTNLRTITIRSSHLSTLSPEIGSLKYLKYLTITNSHLRSLPSEIGLLEELEMLDLSNNRLERLPDEFSKLSKLNNLTLDNNLFQSMPDEIIHLESLKHLNMMGAQITEIPQNITELVNLETLNLGNNFLTKLPAEIGQLGNLKWLKLQSNKIEELPPEIGTLSSLTGLQISNNLLTELPPEIGQLSNVLGLSLNYNQIIELPPEIGNLTKLNDLQANNNKLTTIPAEMGKLKNLKHLDLANNQITHIPTEAKSVFYLKSSYWSSYNFPNVLSAQTYQDIPTIKVQDSSEITKELLIPELLRQVIDINGVYNEQLEKSIFTIDNKNYSFYDVWNNKIDFSTVFTVNNEYDIKIRTYTRTNISPYYYADNFSNHTYSYKLRVGNSVTGTVTEQHIAWDNGRNEVLQKTVHTGELGETYEFSPLELDGYTLNYFPPNASGVYTKMPITVIFYYEKERKPITSSVNEQHILVDKNGAKTIYSETLHTGNVDMSYHLAPKIIAGYTLRAVPTNASGTYTQSPITVTFYYDQDAVKPPTGQNFYSYFEDLNFAEIVAATVGKQAADDTNEKELSTIKEVVQAGVEDEEIESLNGIRYLTGLRKLVLNDHLISEIPTEILGLKRLKHLDVRNNQIMVIDEDILGALNLGYGNFLFQGQQADAPRVDYVHGSAATPADLIPDVVLQGIRYDEIYHGKSETEMRKQTIVTVRKISLRNIKSYTLEEFTNGTFDMSQLSSGLYTIDMQSPTITENKYSSEGHRVRFQLKISGDAPQKPTKPIRPETQTFTLDPTKHTLTTTSGQYHLDFNGEVSGKYADGVHALSLAEIKALSIAINVHNNKVGNDRLMTAATIEKMELTVEQGIASKLIFTGRVQTPGGTLEKYTITFLK